MNAEIDALKTRLIEGMTSYKDACLQNGDDPGYSDKEISTCQSIVYNFLKALSVVPHGNVGAVTSAVKGTVLALNDLNEKSGFSLIETDQREDLAMLIIKAAEAVGVGNGSDDLTEAWREW